MAKSAPIPTASTKARSSIPFMPELLGRFRAGVTHHRALVVVAVEARDREVGDGVAPAARARPLVIDRRGAPDEHAPAIAARDLRGLVEPPLLVPSDRPRARHPLGYASKRSSSGRSPTSKNS